MDRICSIGWHWLCQWDIGVRFSIDCELFGTLALAEPAPTEKSET